MRDAAGGAKLRPGRGCKMRQPASGRRRQRQVARYFVPLISPERRSVRDTGRLISSIGVVSVAMGIEFLGGKCRTHFCLLRSNLTPICVRPPALDLSSPSSTGNEGHNRRFAVGEAWEHEPAPCGSVIK